MIQMGYTSSTRELKKIKFEEKNIFKVLKQSPWGHHSNVCLQLSHKNCV